MTVNDFNHLMNSIKGLSPEQARRMREQLDHQLTAHETARQDRQTCQGRRAAGSKETHDVRRVQSAAAAGRPTRFAAKSSP